MAWPHISLGHITRTAGRLAFQVVPSLMSLRLSQHQVCAVQHVGFRLPFVHSVASSCAPLCVGTMDSVMHNKVDQTSAKSVT
jgi:hypothetical protein